MFHSGKEVILGLEKNIKESLPEAPAAVTARIVTDKGFHLLFTLRDTTVESLMVKFEKFQNAAILKGWKPDLKDSKDGSFRSSEGKSSSSITETTEATCAICGAPAKKKAGHRKDGSLWEGIFCSTGEDSHKMWLN